VRQALCTVATVAASCWATSSVRVILLYTFAEDQSSARLWARDRNSATVRGPIRLLVIWSVHDVLRASLDKWSDSFRGCSILLRRSSSRHLLHVAMCHRSGPSPLLVNLPRREQLGSSSTDPNAAGFRCNHTRPRLSHSRLHEKVP
jgi:hypothetical protein